MCNVNLAFLLGFVVLSGDVIAQETRPSLKRYESAVKISDDLYKTHERLAAALKKGDEKAIKAICLPGVEITTAVRAIGKEEYGNRNDINLPFSVSKFSEEIFSAKVHEEGIVSLRTGSSNITYVQLKNGEWRICAYLDKPIQ